MNINSPLYGITILDTFQQQTPKELFEGAPVMSQSSLIQRRIVEVRFDNNGTLSEKFYAYFTDIEDLKPGDYVVVVVGEVPKTAMVSKVRGISKDSQNKANKWIAFRVDLTNYYIKVRQDEVIRQIEEELDAEMQRINRLEVLKSCAKNSPVMSSLMKKLEELNPNIKLLED